MRATRTAVAFALLFAALAAAGCGLGPGSKVGDAELTVTRDYGTVPVLHRQLGDLTESDTVIRVLERNADITTRYGGGFVQSIEGLEAEESADGSFDWFFYVNGVESTIGAADYSLHGGESIWWDYRDWDRQRCACRPWSAPGRNPSSAATTANSGRWRSNASVGAAPARRSTNGWRGRGWTCPRGRRAGRSESWSVPGPECGVTRLRLRSSVARK